MAEPERMTAPDNPIRRSFRITGLVQGVGFRWWVRREARALGLRGTVRNLDDGSVQVDVEAHPEPLEDFHTRLRLGPPLARVDEIEDLEPGSGPLPSDFQIVQ
jgi:acylphosphatase